MQGRCVTREYKSLSQWLELTQAEVKTLQQLGPVNPGRYWVNAQGVGEIEDSSPQLGLSVLFKKRNMEYNRTTPGGAYRGR